MASGRLRESIGRDERERPYVSDLELAKSEWTRNAGRGPKWGASGPQRPQGEHRQVEAPAGVVVAAETLAEAQRLATLQRERKLRLENDQREGRLLSVERVTKEQFESMRVIREALLNIPARLAAEIAAELGIEAGPLHIRMDAALRDGLNQAADRVLAQAHG